MFVCCVYATFALPIRNVGISSFTFMKMSEFLKRLQDAGCVLDRHGSRHDKWTNPKTGKSDWVPRHAREVPTGLANKILKKLVGG